MERGAQITGPAGQQGSITWPPDIDYERATYDVDGLERVAPFGPWLVWSPTPAGGIVAGASDGYRYEVHRRDGTRLLVERYWEPVPVPAEQKEWERRYAVASQRQGSNPEFSWDGAEIPDHKPAFASLIPGRSGEIWVYRRGDSKRLSNCVQDPIAAGRQAARENRCWGDDGHLDVFGDDGRYLGEVAIPAGLRPSMTTMSAEGLRVVSRFEDEAGTIMVKRYRLVLPGEEQ